jgi:hypothetical protein
MPLKINQLQGGLKSGVTLLLSFDKNAYLYITMAPSHPTTGYSETTSSYSNGCLTCSTWVSSTGTTKVCQAPETKQEKKARIAREKMFASWKLYNLRTVSVKQIKQICKPRHMLSFSGQRKG